MLDILENLIEWVIMELGSIERWQTHLQAKLEEMLEELREKGLEWTTEDLIKFNKMIDSALNKALNIKDEESDS